MFPKMNQNGTVPTALILGPAKDVLMYTTGGVYACNWTYGMWFSGLGTMGRVGQAQQLRSHSELKQQKHQSVDVNLIFRGY